MKELPKISIVIPVFNGSRFLEDTMKSVIDQQFTDFELLIINDGSTDDTERIVLTLQSRDSRIFYYKRPNAGVSASRNFGLERVRGEFVVFLDADDIIKPDFLQSRLEFLLKHPEIGICGSIVRFIDEDNQLKRELPDKYAPGENILEDILYYRSNISCVPSNLMHRRSLLTEHQITFDTRLNSSADKMFLCRLASLTKSYCLPAASFYYRIHPTSMYHDPGSRMPNFKDSERFIRILKRDKIVPEKSRYLFLVKNYYMLAGAAWNRKFYSRVVLYGMKYFLVRARFLG